MYLVYVSLYQKVSFLYERKKSSLNFSTEFVLWQNFLLWFQTSVYIAQADPLLERQCVLTAA